MILVSGSYCCCMTSYRSQHTENKDLKKQEFPRRTSKYCPINRLRMMTVNYRILHCGDSLDNYYICIQQKVAGFTRRVADVGDIVYMVVKVNNRLMCGARAKLTDVTDFRPWNDADQYPQCFTLVEIAYCNPFDIGILERAGGKHWSLKYVQSAKAIQDEHALKLLEESFAEGKSNELFLFEHSGHNEADFDVPNQTLQDDDYESFDAISKIAGTYVTIKSLSMQLGSHKSKRLTNISCILQVGQTHGQAKSHYSHRSSAFAHHLCFSPRRKCLTRNWVRTIWVYTRKPSSTGSAKSIKWTMS